MNSQKGKTDNCESNATEQDSLSVCNPECAPVCNPERIRNLFDALEDDNPVVSSNAEDAIYEEITEECIPLLVELLSSDYWQKKTIAIELLGFLEARWAIHEIIKLLDDESHQVQLQAAETLGDFRAQEAVPFLLRRLDDRNFGVMAYTAEALGKIGDRSAIGALNHILASLYHIKASFDRFWTVAHFWAALFMLGKKKYLKLLLESLRRKRIIPVASLLAVVAENAELYEKYTILRSLKDAANKVDKHLRGSYEGVHRAVEIVEDILQNSCAVIA